MNAYALVPVTATDAAGQEVLRNLTKMYCYEWSQYTGMDVDAQGAYAFEKHLASYWEKPDRKAFLLRCAAGEAPPRWAGFALMDRDLLAHKDYDHSLAEFFVLYKYRRQGAGRWMARELFTRFPGLWELGRNPKNPTTARFWDRVVCEYTGGEYELLRASPAHRYADGTLGDIFAFDSRPSTGGPCVMETERLRLRELTMDDLPALHAILSDPETMRYYPAPFDRARTESWIRWNMDNYKAYGFGLWAVVLKATGELIGDCGLTMQNIYGDGRLFPEVGYHIDRAHWRQGYATEAARACLRYAFARADLNEVFCYQKHTNLPSRKTAEKLGLTLREEYPDEKNTKTSVYAITRAEYEGA